MNTTITILTDKQAQEIAREAAELVIERIALRPEVVPREVMNAKELCEYLRCSYGTIRKKIKNDGLPVCYRLSPRAPRFLRSEINKWLQDK